MEEGEGQCCLMRLRVWSAECLYLYVSRRITFALLLSHHHSIYPAQSTHVDHIPLATAPHLAIGPFVHRQLSGDIYVYFLLRRETVSAGSIFTPSPTAIDPSCPAPSLIGSDLQPGSLLVRTWMKVQVLRAQNLIASDDTEYALGDLGPQ